MGNSPKQHQNALRKEDWVLVEQRLEKSLWRHSQHHSLLIEQKPQPPSPDLLFNQTMTLIWRQKCPHLVGAYQLEESRSGNPCESVKDQALFVEHIPIRLSHVEHIPFPDYLHLCDSMLRGFEYLSQRTHFFRVEEDMVGFNIDGVAKVWLSGDYWSVSAPDEPVTEPEMVRSILLMLEECIDDSPPPRVAHLVSYMYRDNADLTFSRAQWLFGEYVREYYPRGIPGSMECIEKVGGAKFINDKVVKLRANYSSILVQQTMKGGGKDSQVEYYAVVEPPAPPKHNPIATINSQYLTTLARPRAQPTPIRTPQTAIDSLRFTTRNSSIQTKYQQIHSPQNRQVSAFSSGSQIGESINKQHKSMPKTITGSVLSSIRSPQQNTPTTPQAPYLNGATPQKRGRLEQGLTVKPVTLTDRTTEPPRNSLTQASGQPLITFNALPQTPSPANKRSEQQCGICEGVSRVRFSKIHPYPSHSSIPSPPA